MGSTMWMLLNRQEKTFDGYKHKGFFFDKCSIKKKCYTWQMTKTKTNVRKSVWI